MLKNHIYDLIKNRRATKRMLPDFTVSDEDLRIITETIRYTSMSYGVWDYRIVVVPRGKIKDELIEPWSKQPSFINASHIIIFLNDKEQYIREVAMKKSFDQQIPDSAANVRDIMTSAVLDNWKINNVNPTEWSAKQAYIALGTAMIVAADLNIDSAPYEGFNRTEVEKVLEKNGLMNREIEAVAMGIGLGKADLNDPMVHFFDKTRMSEEEFTTIAK